MIGNSSFSSRVPSKLQPNLFAHFDIIICSQSPKHLCSVVFSTEKYGALFCVFGVSVVGASFLPMFLMVGCVIQDCILQQRLVSGGVLLF